MGWKKCLKNLVLVALVALVVIVEDTNVDCKELGDSIISTTTSSSNGFVERNGKNFIVNGKHLYFNGFNAYWLMILAYDPSTSSKVTSALQQARNHGLTVARTWAFNDGSAYKALQVSPGSYDPNVFKGLDFVISEAGKNGIRLILSLVNNWNDFGGKSQYVQWAREHGQSVKGEDDFFTHPLIKQYYKNHAKAILTRKNTITQVAYKDDPTIFAWELMNEPRSIDNSGKMIEEWVIEMAAYVKSIDSTHLLEVGLEGFYGETTPEKLQFNPNKYEVGTDFIANNLVPQIDFATINLYPVTWLNRSTEEVQAAFVDKWVEAHFQDSKNVLGKPIIIGEFAKSSRSPGYTIEERDSYMKKLYGLIYTSASSGGACAGGLFWQLMAQGMDSYRDGNEIVLEESPSTATIIQQQSQKMSTLA